MSARKAVDRALVCDWRCPQLYMQLPWAQVPFPALKVTVLDGHVRLRNGKLGLLHRRRLQHEWQRPQLYTMID